MKRIISATLALIMGSSVLLGATTAASTTSTGPYEPVYGGCITDIKMESESKIGEVSYFTATVSSRVQGLDTSESIPYKTYGAIGTQETKMFVYSMGSADGLDYSRATVKQLVELFEKENPGWNALAAVNGDFFDIETKKTSSMGEPESAMIQLGDVYKSFIIPSATGRGLVGTTAEGKMVYYTVGDIYKRLGFGTPLEYEIKYSLCLYGEDGEEVLAEYSSEPDWIPYALDINFFTPQSEPADLSGTTVFVVKCDTYRRAHVGINGAELGTHGYFIEGEITEVRDGKMNDRPRSGEVYFATRLPEEYELLKVGTRIKCQKKLSGEWAEVENAIGFKQQILANGECLLKNAYGRNYTSGDKEETLTWTEDIYDYPYCNKHRTAIGFRDDGTPVILVIAKSSHSGEYKNLGATYYEIAEQLKSLGCTNGFLLDGGGSSTFVIRKNDSGRFTTVFAGEGSGRAVANAVILAVRDVPEEEPTPSPENPTTPPSQDPNGDTPQGGNTDTPQGGNTDTPQGGNTDTPQGGNTDTPQGDNTNTPQGNGAQPNNNIILKIAIPALAVLAAGVCATCLLIKKKKKKK